MICISKSTVLSDNYNMEVKFKKLYPEARLPEYAHEDDAGADLFCIHDVILQPNERQTIPLGLAAEFSADYVALFHDKSGLASKRGLTCLAGVIDASYRGEWAVVIYNTSTESQTLKAGDKVAQVLFQKIEHPQFVESLALTDTIRAEGGFGSTGQ